jgi:acetyltransferase-like isoleucine patch superfamily enzyme
LVFPWNDGAASVQVESGGTWTVATYLKKTIDLLALVAVLPAFLIYRAAAAGLGKKRAFPGWSQFFSLFPGTSGVFLRRAFYRLTLLECAPNVCLEFGTIFAHPGARIGRGVYVGAFCVLGEIVLEDDVLLASHVSVMNGPQQHGIERLDIPIRLQPGRPQRVSIGADSWIGEHAVVMADVGQHCVIGAGAVVVKPIPSFAIAVGVPAKVIGYRKGAPQGAIDVRSQADSLPASLEP